MLNLTIHPNKFIHQGMTLALGAALFLAGPAGAADYPEPKLEKPDYYEDYAAPIVFQATGPTAESIQSMVDAFRAALGEPNNGNDPGPLDEGRREINWDGGGGVDVTTEPITPFDVFLDSRGGQFITPGKGLSQAPPEGGPQDGLAGLFNNPTYGAIFSTFSLCACSPLSTATSPRLCSSSPAPRGKKPLWSVALVRSSPMWISRTEAGLTRSLTRRMKAKRPARL